VAAGYEVVEVVSEKQIPRRAWQLTQARNDYREKRRHAGFLALEVSFSRMPRAIFCDSPKRAR
jgi:hypothetical protein